MPDTASGFLFSLAACFPLPVSSSGFAQTVALERPRGYHARGLFGVRPHLPSGRLKALAVTTGKRTPAAPELPTVAEAGLPGYEVDHWYGVLTGAKVPAAIVSKINAGLNEALRSPEVVKRFSADGSTPKEFGAHIRSEITKWRKLGWRKRPTSSSANRRNETRPHAGTGRSIFSGL